MIVVINGKKIEVEQVEIITSHGRLTVDDDRIVAVNDDDESNVSETKGLFR